jgi:hypothetical protein
VFTSFHTAAAYAQMEQYYVGELEAPKASATSESATVEAPLRGGARPGMAPGEVSPFERDYRLLGAELKEAGFYKSR